MVTDDSQSLSNGLPARWAALFQLLTIVLCISIAGATALPPKASKTPAILVRNTKSNTSVELIHDAIPSAEEPTASTKVIWMEVTAYCACTHCCGPNACGLTASGKDVGYNNGAFVAADTDLLAFGTHIVIPGYNNDQPVEVIDRGSAIKGNHLDVFFTSHEQALEWGRRRVAVTIAQ